MTRTFTGDSGSRAVAHVFVMAILFASCSRLEDKTGNFELTSSQPRSETSLHFLSPIIDLGTLESGEEKQAVFEFRNDTPHPIRINDVRGSCGCIISSIQLEGIQNGVGTEVPPGGRGQISATLNTTGFIGTKTVTVEVNTIQKTKYVTPPASEKSTKLSIVANITRDLEFEANSALIRLGEVSSTETVERSTVLKSNTGSPFTVTHIDPSDSDSIQIAAKPLDSTRTRWSITVSILSGRVRGNFTRMFTISTDRRNQRPNLYVTGTFLP